MRQMRDLSCHAGQRDPHADQTNCTSTAKMNDCSVRLSRGASELMQIIASNAVAIGGTIALKTL